MIIQKYLQGTDEWLEWRKTGIGASDMAAVMGVSPFKTPYQLWEEMLNIRMPEGESPPMKHGKREEAVARSRLEDLLDTQLFPVCGTSDKYPWMLASFDGVSMNGKIGAEIKNPFRFKIEDDVPKTHVAAMAGEIPEYYKIQMQQQYCVGGLERHYYFSRVKGAPQEEVLIPVERDDELIAKIIEAGEQFMECVKTRTPPPLLDRDDKPMDDCSEWCECAELLKEAKHQIEINQNIVKRVNKKLIELAEDHNAKGAGIKLTRYYRKGTVDYSSVPELKEVDLEKYRRPETLNYRIYQI